MADGPQDEEADDPHRIAVRVAREKLRIETRKWILAKCLPKIYGDRVQQEVSGPNRGPIEVDVTDRCGLLSASHI
jgi:hypothetical protein